MKQTNIGEVAQRIESRLPEVSVTIAVRDSEFTQRMTMHYSKSGGLDGEWHEWDVDFSLDDFLLDFETLDDAIDKIRINIDLLRGS